MNVNSIKINNVYYNGEVDLDELLPEAVEDLTVIKGLDENKEILGAKNLLPLTLENLKALNTSGTWSGNNYMLNGITFTIQTDSNNNVAGIRCNGQATASMSFYVYVGTATIPNGAKFNLNASKNTSGYDTHVTNGSSEIAYIVGTSAQTAESALSDTTFTQVSFYFNRNYNNDVILHPMIRLATDPNPTYRPYAMSNQELTQRLLSLEQRVTALEG